MARMQTPNVNFLPTDPRGLVDKRISALRWRMDELNEVAVLSGYSAIQLHDGRAFAHVRELRAASPERAAQLGRYIHSMHEGWQGVADPIPKRLPERSDSQGKGRAVLRLGSAVLFANGADTLDHLEAIEAKLGRVEPLGYVMYPDIHGNKQADQAKTQRFPGSRMQPTIDVAASWDTLDPQAFAKEAAERGYRITWDTVHGDRKGKMVDHSMYWHVQLPPLVEAGVVDELHVGAFRYDFQDVDPKRSRQSNYEGKALAGTEGYRLDRTRLGDTFAYLREQAWEGDVTLEAPLSGIAMALGPIATQGDIISVHSTMTDVIREQLPQITWEVPVVE